MRWLSPVSCDGAVSGNGYTAASRRVGSGTKRGAPPFSVWSPPLRSNCFSGFEFFRWEVGYADGLVALVLGDTGAFCGLLLRNQREDILLLFQRIIGRASNCFNNSPIRRTARAPFCER